MSWAGLASNQTISFNNLQNGVDTGQFTAKTSIPVSDEQITKTDANTYVNIDTAYAPYASKASNQLVAKSDLVTTTTTTTPPTTTTTTTPPATAFAGTTSTFADAATACANKTCGRAYYRPTSLPIFVNGVVVYDDATLTTPFNGGNNWVAIDTSLTFCSGTGWRAIQIDTNGVIIGVVSCP